MGDLVYLAYENPEVNMEGDTFMLACRRCRNKTYRLECQPDCAAGVYCAACGQFIGEMGWMPPHKEVEPPA